MKQRVSIATVLFGLAIAAVPASGQEPKATIAVETIAARPADVATIDGIIAAFYDVITGPAGQPRQWARDRTLYVPGIRFVAMEYRNGKPDPHLMTHQQYVDGSNAMFVKNGFFEREIHRVVHRMGSIAQVASTYETRGTATGPVLGRGVNTLELYFDGTRWWIAAVMWEDERPGTPLPAEFLPAKP